MIDEPGQLLVPPPSAIRWLGKQKRVLLVEPGPDLDPVPIPIPEPQA